MQGYTFFLIFAKNKDCGYSLEPPRRGGSNVYPRSVFIKNEKISKLFTEHFRFYNFKNLCIHCITWACFRNGVKLTLYLNNISVSRGADILPNKQRVTTHKRHESRQSLHGS